MQLHQNALVLALHRRGTPIRDQLSSITVAVGDALLLAWSAAPTRPDLRREGDPHPGPTPGAPSRGASGCAALGIAVAVLVAASMNWVPITVGALAGILSMVMTRVLTLEETDAAINWRVIAMLAAMIPLGIAMEKRAGRLPGRIPRSAPPAAAVPPSWNWLGGTR